MFTQSSLAFPAIGNSGRSGVPFGTPSNIRLTMIPRGRQVLALAIRLCVVAMLVLCVFVSILPRSVVASAFGVNDCCFGKSAGHCVISLRKKRQQPKPEPMCGAKSSAADDTVTILADENTKQSGSPAAARPDPCSDCPSCALGSKQRTRDKSFAATQPAIIPVPNSLQTRNALAEKLETVKSVTHISPRGPPVI